MNFASRLLKIFARRAAREAGHETRSALAWKARPTRVDQALQRSRREEALTVDTQKADLVNQVDHLNKSGAGISLHWAASNPCCADASSDEYLSSRMSPYEMKVWLEGFAAGGAHKANRKNLESVKSLVWPIVAMTLICAASLVSSMI